MRRISLLIVLVLLVLRLDAQSLSCNTGDGTSPPPETPPPTGTALVRSCALYRCTFTVSSIRPEDIRRLRWEFNPPAADGVTEIYKDGAVRSIVRIYAPPDSTTVYRARVSVEYFTGETEILPAPANWLSFTFQKPPLDGSFSADHSGKLLLFFGADPGIGSDPNNPFVSPYIHSWEFGDLPNEPVQGTSYSICKAFTMAGTFRVKHTIRDVCLYSYPTPCAENPTTIAWSEGDVTITNEAPLLSVSTPTQQGKVVTFKASALDEPSDLPGDSNTIYRPPGVTNCYDVRTSAGVTYEWDFGDGQFGTGANPTHAYTTPGVYKVSVTAKDADGSARVLPVSNGLTIPSDPPVAALDFNCAYPRSCTFDASRSTDDGGVTQYRWNFGDGPPQVTSEPSVQHTYATNGSFAVTVEAGDGTAWSTPARRLPSVTDIAPTAASRYFPTVPCRIYDSRSSGGPVPRGTAIQLQLGPCGVSATATAAVVGLTVVGPAGPGNLVAYPATYGVPQTSVLNFAANTSPRSAQATVRAQNGVINLWVSTSATDVVVDVFGYYSADAAPVSPLAVGPYGYAALTDPCRIFNSFTAGVLLTSPNPRYLKFRGAPVDPALQTRDCGIPADARAAAFTFTSVGASAGGHVAIIPSDMPSWSATSNITLPGGTNIENGVTMRLAARASDDVAMAFSSTGPGNTMNYIVDAFGYYSPSAPLRFKALAPCRLVDTREPQRGENVLGASETRRLQVQGNCGVPRGAVAAAVTATVVGPENYGHLTVFATGRPHPESAILNYNPGDTIANGVVLPLGSGQYDLSVWSMRTTQLILDVYGYFEPAVAGQINSKVEETAHE